MTLKVSLMRLINLDHKMMCHDLEPWALMRQLATGFDVVLCKYELLLEKLLSMSIREIIWPASLESMLKLDPYIDVDDVVGHEPN